MSATKEISVSVGLTLNLGNFESTKIQAGVVRSIEQYDDEKAEYKVAWEMCEEEIRSQVAGVKATLNKG